MGLCEGPLARLYLIVCAGTYALEQFPLEWCEI